MAAKLKMDVIMESLKRFDFYKRQLQTKRVNRTQSRVALKGVSLFLFKKKITPLLCFLVTAGASPYLCVICVSGSGLSRALYLPRQLGSSLPATGTGCPWRWSRERGAGGFRGAKEEIVTSENERGFDVKGGAIRFGRGPMRSNRRGGRFGQMQGVRFGVGVDVKLLRGWAQGVKERGWAVPSAAGWRGRARGHRFGAGGNGTHTRRCSGAEMVVRERVGRARRGGRGGRRGRGVRGRRPLLLWGGVGVTGVRPIGGCIV